MLSCTKDNFPIVPNGYKQKMKKYGDTAFKVKCNRGYKRVGPSLIHCERGTWDVENMPVCASKYF